MDMTFQDTETGATSPQDLKDPRVYRHALRKITHEISSAQNLDSILLDLNERMLDFFDCERNAIYVIDDSSNQLFTRFKVGTMLSEIRIPISAENIAGYSALTGTVLNIADAYDEEEVKAIHPELHFDQSWDGKSGYRTTQVLATPIRFEGKILGVLQLTNRNDGSSFTRDDETSAGELAQILATVLQKH